MKVNKLAAIIAARWLLMAAQGAMLGESGEAFGRAVRERDGA